ncbi:hypothetical protein EON65_04590 [archaeon]|nr:MAG: hypothetical protein EON65_04590 [archaeon]
MPYSISLPLTRISRPFPPSYPGLFYSWPMLYGWIYPQLMMVLMIMVTYSSISPLLMPPCILFFMGAYIMYKYQLLYVYINEYQSGGFMWYAVFTR